MLNPNLKEKGPGGQRHPARRLRFVKLSRSSLFWPTVEQSFTQDIGPIYGDQSAALKKIQRGKDRSCEILLESGTPVGFVVYKTALTNEFQQEHITNAFEIKTLILTKPALNSGRGLASVLLLRAATQARKSGAFSIIVTASTARPLVLDFFYKNGFKSARCFTADSTNFIADEHLLFHDNPNALCLALKEKNELFDSLCYSQERSELAARKEGA